MKEQVGGSRAEILKETEAGGMRLDDRTQRGAEAKGRDMEWRREKLEVG